jgi:hypothetical protein
MGLSARIFLWKKTPSLLSRDVNTPPAVRFGL